MAEEKLEGIKGWLLFFVILSGVNLAVQCYYLYETLQLSVSGLQLNIILAFQILAIIFSFISFVLLVVKDNSAVGITLFTMWFIGISTFFVSSFAPASFLFPLIWTVYLLNSDRVKNTYCRK